MLFKEVGVWSTNMQNNQSATWSTAQEEQATNAHSAMTKEQECCKSTHNAKLQTWTPENSPALGPEDLFHCG